MPFQSKNRPPKVKITEAKGSIIKNNFSFLFNCVVLKIKPNKKKIMDIDKIWLCTKVSISWSLFLNFMTSACSSDSFPKYCSSIPFGVAEDVSSTNNNPVKNPMLKTTRNVPIKSLSSFENV